MKQAEEPDETGLPGCDHHPAHCDTDSNRHSTRRSVQPITSHLISSDVTRYKILSFIFSFISFISVVTSTATNYWARYNTIKHPFKPPGHMRTQYVDIIGHCGLWQLCSNLSPDAKQHYYGTVLCEQMSRIEVEGRPLWYYLPAWFEAVRCLVMLSLAAIFFSFFPSGYLLLVNNHSHSAHVIKMNIALYLVSILFLGSGLLVYSQHLSELSGAVVQGARLHLSLSWSLYLSAAACALLLLAVLCLAWDWRQSNRILFQRMRPVAQHRKKAAASDVDDEDGYYTEKCYV